MILYGARDIDLLETTGAITPPRRPTRATFTARQVAEIIAEFAAGTVIGAVAVAWWLS